jgi:AcrR family transcriptional regulator
MLESMGRPREHDEQTAIALLQAAELAVERDGPDALSIRGVAQDARTTTRAVYSLFASKQGLLAALAAHGFDLLREGMQALPVTDRPEADLIEAGLVIRRFAVEHPSLFRIAFRNTDDPFMRSNLTVRAAAMDSLAALKARINRLGDSGLIEGQDVAAATVHFRALCDGLAGLELAGTIDGDSAEGLWRQGLSSLIRGLTLQPGARRTGADRSL